MKTSIIAREGWFFIALFGVSTLIFFIRGSWFIGLPFLFITLFIAYFFRNPERVRPEGDGLVLAPADGRVVEVSDLEQNRYTDSPAKKVGIFMSVLNVHVNRVPISGRVKGIVYHPGKFLVASTDKASEDNERNAVLIDAGRKSLVAVVQIAGLIARRIVCYLKEGDVVQGGERLGLIKFGSRVDIYLPLETEVNVSKGERVKAGVTVIGRLK